MPPRSAGAGWGWGALFYISLSGTEQEPSSHMLSLDQAGKWRGKGWRSVEGESVDRTLNFTDFFLTLSHDSLPHSPSLLTKPCFFWDTAWLQQTHSFPPGSTLDCSNQSWEVLKPPSTPSLPGGSIYPKWNKPAKEKIQSSSFLVCMCTHLHTIFQSYFCLCSQIQFCSSTHSVHAHLYSLGFSSLPRLSFPWKVELTVECFNHSFLN